MLDFGLARETTRLPPAYADDHAGGALIGTPATGAEQIRGLPVDAARRLRGRRAALDWLPGYTLRRRAGQRWRRRCRRFIAAGDVLAASSRRAAAARDAIHAAARRRAVSRRRCENPDRRFADGRALARRCALCRHRADARSLAGRAAVIPCQVRTTCASRALWSPPGGFAASSPWFCVRPGCCGGTRAQVAAVASRHPALLGAAGVMSACTCGRRAYRWCAGPERPVAGRAGGDQPLVRRRFAVSACVLLDSTRHVSVSSVCGGGTRSCRDGRAGHQPGVHRPAE